MSEHTNNDIQSHEPANDPLLTPVNESSPGFSAEEPIIKPRRFKALNIIGFSLLGIVALIAILICAATYYLSPERLEKLIAKAASENLNAEVTVTNPRFTLWSSLPHFNLQIDSVRIVSKSLRGIPESLRSQIPDNADFLASTGNLKGEVNIFKLIKGQIQLGNIEADAINLNIVMVSDSLTNFNILKDTMSTGKIPYFTAREILLTNPGQLKFFNRQAGIAANLDLNTLKAVRDVNDKNSYNADIKGNVGLIMGGKTLLNNFPVHLHGKTRLGFEPLVLNLNGFNIDLGNLKGITDLAVTLEGKQEIESLNYRLEEVPLSAILSMLPEGTVNWPEALEADPVIGLNARLKSPYPFTSKEMPSVDATVSIPPGELRYKEKSLPLLSMSYSPIDVKVDFDGKNPESSSVRLLPFTVSGEGAEVTLNPEISDLAGDTRLHLEVNGKYDAAAASRFFSALSKYALKGDLEGSAKIDLRKSDITENKLQDIAVDADLTLKNYSTKIPKEGIALGGNSMSITAKGGLNNIDVTASADKFNLKQGKSADITLSGFKLTGKTSESSKGKGMKIDIDVTGKSLTAASGVKKVILNDFSTDFTAQYSEAAIKNAPFAIPAKWDADSSAMAYTTHSDQYMVMKLPPKFTNVIRHWKPDVKIKVKSGSILTPVLPLHNDFNDLDVEASFDGIKLNKLKMNSQDTRLMIAGKVSNLRPFLTSRTPVPLKMYFDLQMDTLYVNQLAGAYNHGIKYRHGPQASFLTVIPDTLIHADTVAMLLPRNLDMDLKAHIMMYSYTNIQLKDLGTTVTLKDGNLKVNDLKIESFFGDMGLDFTYNTSDISNLGMGLTFNMADVELVNFFSRFHTLLLMMPPMQHVRGTISLGADAKVLLFPNMYINLPSVWADFYLNGYKLTILENKEMHRITRLLGIHDKGGIYLNNLNIHGSISDNLFRIYPFDIDVHPYKLRAGGIYSFGGDMYFHAAVDKSPIPFPFGVSVTGTMKHPKLHLGGTKFSTKDAEAVSNNIAGAPNVNLLLSLQQLVREMLAKAAEADTTSTSSYVY